MAANTRFATGVHILVFLAAEPDKMQTSTRLAEYLNTNPVVIRRVLSALHRADLVVSQKGPTGGSRLAKPAKTITLADIYKAVEINPLFYKPEVSGGLAGRVNGALDRVLVRAKSCVIEEFKGTTLSQLIKKLGKPTRK